MTEPTPDHIDGADMPLPPAIYPLICVGGGYFLNKYLPLGAPEFLTGDAALKDKLAAAALLAALLLFAWAIRTLRAHKTTLLPHKAVATLVTSGPFNYSRNPIYLGFNLLLLAMFFSTLNLWLAILAPLNIGLLQYYVILPEEKHLAESFQSAYHDYQSRVRRWL
ncbi:MAG: isoprenylcysteine carboxylmethyltransferase family protein [Gammaproteobacteria bacterium]|nr:isoprenylcysteine carboxylmethyltransferase family protein [Gammaproteobacteria bacterium]MBQ0840553.1 isoprenylcysteine carboxylmethyltransferase family protein [Gammaproteobacteria bacterium]